MSNIQKYAPMDVDAMEDMFKEFSGGGAKNYLKLPEGTTVIRVLPPPVGAGYKYMVPCFQHYFKPPGAERGASFFCPRGEKKPCPMCNRYFLLKESGNPKDAEFARHFSAGRKVVMNVIDRANPNDGPKLFTGAAKSIGERLREIAKGQDVADGEFSSGLSGDFTDPVNGFDIAIRRKGTGTATEYEVIAGKVRKPLSQDAAEATKWLDAQKDLNKVVTPASVEEILAHMEGAAKPVVRGPTAPKNAQDILDGDFTEDDQLPF